MPFNMYGDVILSRDVTEHGLRAGDVGTVVERDAVPGVAEEGSDDFFDVTGNTVAVATLPASALRLSDTADRPAVRALTPERNESKSALFDMRPRHRDAIAAIVPVLCQKACSLFFDSDAALVARVLSRTYN